MRKLLIRLLLAASLCFVVIGLYRQNSLLRTQLSVLNQTPNRADAVDSALTVSAQGSTLEH